MPTLLIAYLLQSMSLNEFLNQISFPHKIDIALFIREPLQAVAE